MGHRVGNMIDIDRFLDLLEQEVMKYRVPVVDLIGVQSRDAYRVLIATILSSRTKDEVTAAASSRLFDCAPDISSLARLDPDRIRELIYPVGFYKTKAEHIRKTAEILEEKYGEKKNKSQKKEKDPFDMSPRE